MPRKRWNVPPQRKRQRSVGKSVLHKAEAAIEYDSEDYIRNDIDSADVSTVPQEEEICLTPEEEYQQFKTDVFQNVKEPFSINTNVDVLQIVELYKSVDKVSVKLSVTIDTIFSTKIFVHRIELARDHDFWNGLPSVYDNCQSVDKLFSKLLSYSVCIGNFDEEFQALTPVGCGIYHQDVCSPSRPIDGFREGDFGAVRGNDSYSSTIRSISCGLLVYGARCTHCSKLRRILNNSKLRLEDKQHRKKDAEPNYLSMTYKHSDMTREELICKISQQQVRINSLQDEIRRMKSQFQKQVCESGVILDTFESMDMKDAMASCQSEMERAFPCANSFQRLFWEEQLKSINVKSAKGMRWHPMIIRWCLYLRQKSTAAYEALRESGFITLPSSRTLFDYSHYTTSANGFQPDVLKMLKEEAAKKGMLNDSEPWKGYVGLLFGEIKVKSELVYDKNTGELKGYCNLDKVGNQILELQRKDGADSSDIAKFMLVVMVRGIAAEVSHGRISTMSITADYLYPIIWKAVRLLETHLSFKVLFLTCDGAAAANHKFFALHGEDNEFTYCTENPYATDNRKLFFISDVPHLIKTTRICFSNSNSHKKTRYLWKDGKDISWLHVLRLFEDHCELSMYSPCPKLNRSQIDLTAFSRMKVNLAAQVMSSTVANALEMLYGENVTETVNLIRKINKYFDCLNVRNLFEGRNKRNPDLNVYTSTEDERLNWLKTDFLQYFEAWNESVENRPGHFTAAEKKMQLSHQTLSGLKITDYSVVECVTTMLESGAQFVMTCIQPGSIGTTIWTFPTQGWG